MSSFEVSVIRSINQTNDEMILLAQLKIELCREQGLKLQLKNYETDPKFENQFFVNLSLLYKLWT